MWQQQKQQQQQHCQDIKVVGRLVPKTMVELDTVHF